MLTLFSRMYYSRWHSLIHALNKHVFGHRSHCIITCKPRQLISIYTSFGAIRGRLLLRLNRRIERILKRVDQIFGVF